MKAKTPRTLRAQVEALEQEVRADYKGSAAVELADRLATILRETKPEPHTHRWADDVVNDARDCINCGDRDQGGYWTADGNVGSFCATCWDYLQEITRPAEPEGWQPIATAPKDGTDILIGWFEFDPPSSMHVAFWHSTHQGGCWCQSHSAFTTDPNWQPTHWMPLPAPPAPPQEQR